jgi:DNA polymerase epsilon subunit 3
MDTALPTAAVLRVIRDALPPNFHINREAKASLARAGAVFAVYLAAAAADVARDGKRSTLKAADVLRALDDVELPEFAEALRRDLDGARGGRGRRRAPRRCARARARARARRCRHPPARRRSSHSR